MYRQIIDEFTFVYSKNNELIYYFIYNKITTIIFERKKNKCKALSMLTVIIIVDI